MHFQTPARARGSGQVILFFVLMVAVLAARNLPWHLDDYDQAKQAFVSFEMVESGSWWFQHTPGGHIATKPPLAGWLSASLWFLFGGHGWELAWRLPAFASTLLLLAMLWRSGNELGGRLAGMIATGAFALNVLAPHLATLVRTDMMLTFFIFAAGWLIFEKLRSGQPWTTRQRLWFSLVVLGAMLTKGPIVYAFLLPGLVAFTWLMRRQGRAHQANPGAWPWLLPLLIFGLWAGVGIWLSSDFFQQVVLKEFLGRFDLSDAPVHKHQPPWFYLVHLLHKWTLWSVALIAHSATQRARAMLREKPALLWLACWGAGGLLFMSFVPSKRLDRIFPILPPLCLLLAALAQDWAAAQEKRRRVIMGVILLSTVVSGGYAAACVASAWRDQQGALVELGRQVRELTAAQRLAVIDANDEALLLYTGRTRFTHMDDAVDAWRGGQLDWMLVRESDFAEHEPELRPYAKTLELGRIKNKHGPYILLKRTEAQ
ncbi:MAG: hypothetical protein QOE70_2350 [Chthoniobacter sp.]|jgi:4-amino-4-deoxy-L-arabinose transferase-like glycosyltransferase|nr:hypothetical protein [Chthoniobacter sp.]